MNLEKLPLDQNRVRALIELAISEDLDGGVDITSSATIASDSTSTANFLVKRDGVIAGLDLAAEVFAYLGGTSFVKNCRDGLYVASGTVIATVTGNTQKILLAERSALNFLTHLSGIATLTHQWVAAVKGSTAKIRDTRKTIPGLRELEKYAVRMGGGENHRSSLNESALIKDNHILAAGGIKEAVAALRERYPEKEIEVEVDTLAQLEEALESKVKLILLDNMGLEMTKAAVSLTAGRAKLESSGGLTLELASSYAATGVDYLAIGALTHSAPSLDISLDFIEGETSAITKPGQEA